MQVEANGSPPSPILFQSRKKERTLLSASLTKEQTPKLPMYTEKTIYRSQKFPEVETNNEAPAANKSKNFDECSSCGSAGQNEIRPSSYLPPNRRLIHANNRKPSAEIEPNNLRAESPRRRAGQKKSRHDVDWTDLGDKIEDWFESAKTPDQKVVYKFLRELKDEEAERDITSAISVESNVSDKAQSLEDILDHLKKYRHKFNRRSRNEIRSAALPNLASNSKLPTQGLLSQSNESLNKSFESSTWRVMRHLKSADIRNKYPLPKANPDYHFRNATIFQTAGRPPKSTFLLHPDWV